jgi:hypothetical protein
MRREAKKETKDYNSLSNIERISFGVYASLIQIKPSPGNETTLLHPLLTPSDGDLSLELEMDSFQI